MRARAAAAGALAIAALALPAHAVAHASLLGSDPADGSRLGASPDAIRLAFDEDVSAALSRVELRGAHTGLVPGVSVSGESGSGLVVAVPRLRPDTYILRWRTVSEDDLHPTGGAISFGLGAAAATAPLPADTLQAAPSPAARGNEVILRWADFVALAGLIGATTLLAVCVPLALRRGAVGLDATRRWLALMAAATGGLALLTGIALLVVQAQSASTGPGSVLTKTSYGTSWMAREVLIGALLAVVVVQARRPPRRSTTVLAVAVSLALCVALSLSSHSASLRGGLSVATGALALHLYSAAVWAGGVGALALVVVGSLGADARRRSGVRLLLRSFSGLAVLSVAALAITGLYSAGVEVASPGALVTTSYGGVLLAKTALFLLVGLIGFGNTLLLHVGGARSPWLARGVRLEAGFVGAALLAAAFLTSSAPPREPTPARLAVAPSVPRADAVASAAAGDLLVSVSVEPNRPGVNFVTASVFDTRRPVPAPIRAVYLVVRRGVTTRWLEAAKVRPDTWQLVSRRLNRPGPWTIGVRVVRSGLRDEQAAMGWELPKSQPQAPATTPEPSTRSLARIVDPVAGAASAALVVALLALTTRRLLRRGLGDYAPLRSPTTGSGDAP